ncbi:hypothetical protein Tco_0013444 [Tanacetum coccineum]
MDVSIKKKVRKVMEVVSDKLALVQSIVSINSQHVQDLRLMFKDMVLLLEQYNSLKRLMLIGRKNALVLHDSVEKSLEVNSSEKKVTNDEPPVKKLKFLLPTPSLILSLTPLNSIIPEPIQNPEDATMIIEQFTEHLSKTTLFIFSFNPPKESTLPRDPTSPRDESKGKGIASEEPLKEIMPFMEEGGSAPKMLNFKSFSILDGHMTNDDVMAQLKEMKRLADLKDKKEKYGESLKKIMNPATIRAQAQKMAELKTLGFSERLEVHALVSKTKGIPSRPELSTFRVSINDKKRKRSSEILNEVFVKEDIVVDRMHKNLIHPLKVEGRKRLVITEPGSGVFFYNGSFDLVFQREEEFHLATTPQLIRLHNGILRGNPKAKEFFKKLELTIES